MWVASSLKRRMPWWLPACRNEALPEGTNGRDMAVGWAGSEGANVTANESTVGMRWQQGQVESPAVVME